jgi:hypothetical protein
MTAVFKTWVGELPYVIIVNGNTLGELLYYETGFEQLHPIPEIVEWMEERNYKYRQSWKVVRVDLDKGNRSDWALCFNNSEIRDLFTLRWL